MEAKPLSVEVSTGQPVEGSRALVWGNNAAWLCIGCNRLLGNRTGDGECNVACVCGLRYEILRAPNRSGSLNLGPATGVRQQLTESVARCDGDDFG